MSGSSDRHKKPKRPSPVLVSPSYSHQFPFSRYGAGSVLSLEERGGCVVALVSVDKGACVMWMSVRSNGTQRADVIESPCPQLLLLLLPFVAFVAGCVGC